MKKSILLAMVGLTGAVATSAYGQGAILLSNYVSSSNIPSPVMWGPGAPINVSGYTVGLYFAPGDIVSSVAADPTAIAMGGGFWGYSVPTDLNAAFTLGTGLGSTAALAGSSVFGIPGAYYAGNFFNPGLGEGATITVMLVVYNGANYTSSLIRSHSLPFTMTTSVGTAFPQLTGVQETDGWFGVMPIPEPTTVALGGLGLAALLFFRRKRA